MVDPDGPAPFPRARTLLITADGGGSNGPRSRLWKWVFQRVADDFDLTLSVCHFPPSTSKWNKNEHRLLSVISQNWRGGNRCQLSSDRQPAAATTTRTVLRVKAALDTRRYETVRPVPDEVFAIANHAARVSQRLELHHRAPRH